MGDLTATLDEAAAVGRRLELQVQATPDGKPLANAASICRWELLVLRERLLGAAMEPRERGVHSKIVRHLDSAAAAARTLSLGYRLQSLDRICDGGQALDDHLAALSRLRSRL